VLLTYGILYPIWRTTLEMFRGDGERGYVIPGLLSTSQFISLCVASAALVTIFVLRRRALTRIDAIAA
jgi:prolipoprotein diacylglyceryltransferase